MLPATVPPLWQGEAPQRGYRLRGGMRTQQRGVRRMLHSALARLLAARAARLLTAGDPEAAERSVRAALRHGQSPGWWFLLGQSRERRRRWRSAERAYARAVRLAPHRASWHARRADVLRRSQ